MTADNRIEPERIQHNLKTKRIGKKILVFDSVSSTNDTAAEYANAPENDGLVVIAEQQTAGKGRAGNKWFSEKGESLLCSILLINEKLNAELLSLTIAVATAEAINETARIKWPNDVMLNGKKVAGILLESKQVKNNKAYIIGIGINCHQKEFPKALSSIATSIDIETGKIIDRITLSKRLFGATEHWLKNAQTKPAKVIEEWKRLSILLGQRIKLIHNGKGFTGNCAGIDPEAGLILQLDSGAMKFFPASQTTVGK
ncbi:MAG: biotin--[acetyl-CoA-carboxylase] ligase [Phycisphaerae bacterium]|jgi:BirA family biotin operon repressor/biotin-[acetyl-CoA-carboxylase] ligase